MQPEEMNTLIENQVRAAWAAPLKDGVDAIGVCVIVRHSNGVARLAVYDRDIKVGAVGVDAAMNWVHQMAGLPPEDTVEQFGEAMERVRPGTFLVWRMDGQLKDPR